MNPLLIFQFSLTVTDFPDLSAFASSGEWIGISTDRRPGWSSWTWLISKGSQDMPMETWDVQPWNNMDQQPGIFCTTDAKKKTCKKTTKKPAAYQASSSTKGSFLGLTSICSKPTWEGFFSLWVSCGTQRSDALVGTSRNACRKAGWWNCSAVLLTATIVLKLSS